MSLRKILKTLQTQKARQHLEECFFLPLTKYEQSLKLILRVTTATTAHYPYELLPSTEKSLSRAYIPQELFLYCNEPIHYCTSQLGPTFDKNCFACCKVLYTTVLRNYGLLSTRNAVVLPKILCTAALRNYVRPTSPE